MGSMCRQDPEQSPYMEYETFSFVLVMGGVCVCTRVEARVQMNTHHLKSRSPASDQKCDKVKLFRTRSATG